MKSPFAAVAVLLMVLTTLAKAANIPAIIPQPQQIKINKGAFQLRDNHRLLGLFPRPGTKIVVDTASRETAEFLAARLREATDYPFEIVSADSNNLSGNILLTTHDSKSSLAPEGYELAVTPDSVVIRAPTQAGLFYGAQTLLQLLPPEIFSAKPVSGVNWQISCVQIKDWPRFKWRGLMLDVSRHFFTKPEVEKLLSEMAELKMNVFHWHLTDDQGWRIEIKKYPRLTQVGAWRTNIGFGLDPKASTAYGPDGRYGGYYTQDDIREVVKYAAALHITIVPEIEMPGHSTAALAAYPEYSCFGGPYSTEVKRGAHDGVYCAGKDQTFDFLENVLTEVMELFPGKYIHIGGDEVRKDNWKKCPLCQARIRDEGLKNEEELQSYFTKRIEKFISAHGRTLIGWSEILQGGLAQNATVMDWIGGGVEAAREGHDVVMSPTAYCYFDHYQSTNRLAEPKAIGGFLPLNKVYEFEPIPAKLLEQFDSHILGAQANLWAEYVPNFKHAQYMIFPRLAALSEVVWSPRTARDWNSFTNRLPVEFRRFDEQGINYRKGIPEGP